MRTTVRILDQHQTLHLNYDHSGFVVGSVRNFFESKEGISPSQMIKSKENEELSLYKKANPYLTKKHNYW